MRTLAVDYGDVRTGLAVSDLSGTIAGEAWTVTDTDPNSLARYIAGEAAKRAVGLIVVGRPMNMDGSIGPRAEKCEGFAALLREESGLEVVLWDERRTTVDALRILSDAGRRKKKQRARVDAVAATLILEGWLNGPGRARPQV